MHGSRLLIGTCLGIALALTGGAGPAVSGEVSVQLGGSHLRVPVTSIREARFKTIIRQQYDYSCGSAAVASLLTYHYDRPTSEADAFRAMWAVGDQASIRKLGFSLLDMKRYLAQQGLRADGFRVSLDKVEAARIPAITLINTSGYRHFVVIKGIRDGKVLVGDPALGVRIYPRKQFEAIWEGIVFIVRDETEVGRRNFNTDRDWAVRAKAPFGTALQRNSSIGGMTLTLPGLNDF